MGVVGGGSHPAILILAVIFGSHYRRLFCDCLSVITSLHPDVISVTSDIKFIISQRDSNE